MQDAETSALEALRSGFFHLLIATTMLIVVAEFGPAIASRISDVIATILLAALLLTTIIIFLYAVFGEIRPGMRRLSEVDSRFRICYTGTTLMLVGLVIMVLGTAAVVTLGTGYFILNGLVLLVAAFYVIVFIGYVLAFVLGAFKLYGRYKNPLYTAAGTSFVVGIFLTSTGLLGMGMVFEALVKLGSTLATVGYVLTYAALDGTMKKLNTQS